MIAKTVVVVGPGGVGKSPLDALFRDDIIAIAPYRLRSRGPRDANDIFYAHPKLRNELILALNALGDKSRRIGSEGAIEWFPKSKLLFFKVRSDWQFVLLEGLEGQIAKVEIYGPILPLLLSNKEISSLLGSKLTIIVLNPAPKSVTVMEDWQSLKEKTRANCTARGDSPASIKARVGSVAQEAPAWRQLIQEYRATEYCAWRFPEYRYKKPAPGMEKVAHQQQTLINARQCLLKGNSDLAIFFKSEDEIEQMKGLLVK